MAERRRFLVVVRAGDQSLHPAWIDESQPRSFDLVVSYYGRDPGRYRDAPFRRIDDAGQKFIGLKRLFEREAFWRDYDWVWLPDDDLATDQREIDRLFAAVDAMELALAQPALEWHSHFSFGITLQSPTFAVRFTDFVEIMAPCFSRSFLERCLPTFDASLSGWGLSSVWPHLMGAGLRRCGIVDDATVTHTRPVGGPTYDALRAIGRHPLGERAALLAQYGLPATPHPSVLAAIERSGHLLDGRRPDDAARILRRIEGDVRAIVEARAGIPPAELGTRPTDLAPRSIDPQRLREIAAGIRFDA